MVAVVEIHNVCPVCHNHTVPIQVFFQPSGQQLTVGMERQAVVHGRIDHQRKCARLYHLDIRSEMLLAHVLLGYG